MGTGPEGSFWKRVLRGPDYGSGSGGDNENQGVEHSNGNGETDQVRNNEYRRVSGLRRKIPKFLEEEGHDPSVKEALRMLSAGLDSKGLKEALKDAGTALSDDERQDLHDLLRDEKLIEESDLQDDPVVAASPHLDTEPFGISLDAEHTTAPSADSVESPGVGLGADAEAADSPEYKISKIQVEDVEAEFVCTKERKRRTKPDTSGEAGSTASKAEQLRARAESRTRDLVSLLKEKRISEAHDKLIEITRDDGLEVYQEVERQLAAQGVIFGAPAEETTEPAAAAGGEPAAAPAAETATESAATAPTPDADEIDPILGAMLHTENTVADAESPDEREERINDAVESIVRVFDTDEAAAERRLNKIHARFSPDDYKDFVSRLAEKDIHVNSGEPEPEPAPVANEPEPRPLFESEAQLREYFEEKPTGAVFDTAYWMQPDGSAVYFRKGSGAMQLPKGEITRLGRQRWVENTGAALVSLNAEATAAQEREYADEHETEDDVEPAVDAVDETDAVEEETGELSAEVQAELMSAYTAYLKNKVTGMKEGASFWDAVKNLDKPLQAHLMRTLKEENLINHGSADLILDELEGRHGPVADEDDAGAGREGGRTLTRTVEGAKNDFATFVAADRNLQDIVNEIYPTLTLRNRPIFEAWLRGKSDVDQDRLDEALRNRPRRAPRGASPDAAPAAPAPVPPDPEELRKIARREDTARRIARMKVEPAPAPAAAVRTPATPTVDEARAARRRDTEARLARLRNSA